MKNARTPNSRAKPADGTPLGSALGVLRLLLDILFGNRVARLIQQLEDLFEAWRAGTLILPEPRARQEAVIARAPRQDSVRTRHTRAARPRLRPATQPETTPELRVASVAQSHNLPDVFHHWQSQIPASTPQSQNLEYPLQHFIAPILLRLRNE